MDCRYSCVGHMPEIESSAQQLTNIPSSPSQPQLLKPFQCSSALQLVFVSLPYLHDFGATRAQFLCAAFLQNRTLKERQTLTEGQNKDKVRQHLDFLRGSRVMPRPGIPIPLHRREEDRTAKATSLVNSYEGCWPAYVPRSTTFTWLFAFMGRKTASLTHGAYDTHPHMTHVCPAMMTFAGSLLDVREQPNLGSALLPIPPRHRKRRRAAAALGRSRQRATTFCLRLALSCYSLPAPPFLTSQPSSSRPVNQMTDEG